MYRQMFHGCLVSIHAPTRGATPYLVESGLNCWFQSTRPRGARQQLMIQLQMRYVSIHAPTRGATLFPKAWFHLLGFNPRAHAGRDQIPTEHCIRFMFQSTRPRGARLKKLKLVKEPLVSIHAPTRGATTRTHWTAICPGFNPRAHAGRD